MDTVFWHKFLGDNLYTRFAGFRGQELQWAGDNYKHEGWDAYVALEQFITWHADILMKRFYGQPASPQPDRCTQQ